PPARLERVSRQGSAWAPNPIDSSPRLAQIGYPWDAGGRQSAGRRRQRALQQAGVSETSRARREGLGGAAPPQLVHIVEEARVGPERRQILEEEGHAAPVIAEDGGWEVLDDAVAVQQTRRGFR